VFPNTCVIDTEELCIIRNIVHTLTVVNLPVQLLINTNKQQ